VLMAAKEEVQGRELLSDAYDLGVPLMDCAVRPLLYPSWSWSSRRVSRVVDHSPPSKRHVVSL